MCSPIALCKAFVCDNTLLTADRSGFSPVFCSGRVMFTWSSLDVLTASRSDEILYRRCILEDITRERGRKVERE